MKKTLLFGLAMALVCAVLLTSFAPVQAATGKQADATTYTISFNGAQRQAFGVSPLQLATAAFAFDNCDTAMDGAWEGAYGDCMASGGFSPEYCSGYASYVYNETAAQWGCPIIN